ncbi:hypothetical protein TNCV_3343161 [Trichonephila clavipes]|uniref:Uncharacterized protein n=1 Tax=Trichonephila clavipes TaxID=2585209 RepID=A0A8X6WEZ1_TRICX|nr:hypothetical protein TNCV_3343161 [Trichonephila clavipes]
MKKEQDSRQMRSTIVLREQLNLQNTIKCDSRHNKFARMHPKQLKHLSKSNPVSMKIRSATELPEQLKHLISIGMSSLLKKTEKCCQHFKMESPNA